MKNSKKQAFPSTNDDYREWGLNEMEYAAIHLNVSAPALFIQQYTDENKGPMHPGYVMYVFKEHGGLLQHWFDAEEGKWVDGFEEKIPAGLIINVNDHVKKIEAFYKEMAQFEMDRMVSIEVAWRRKVAESLINSFE
jgi:hypothetical protein